MYPYQLGYNNEEAIESGAYWFYRKMGFRPGRRELLQLAEREEARMAREPKYRSSARTLRRLAEGHVFYELPGSEAGAWDRFSTRNIGMRVNQRMRRDCGGDIQRFRESAEESLARIVGTNVPSANTPEKSSFQNFAMVLSLATGLERWNTSEKKALLRIIRAKCDADEMQYLRLLREHKRLRAIFLESGTK